MRAILLMALVVLLALAPSPAHAGDEDRLRNAYRRAKGAEERVKVVRDLGTLESDRSAAMLDKIAGDDPDGWVRKSAVAALGTSKSERATDHLLDLLVAGGPPSWREAVVRAVAARPDGRKRLLLAIDDAGLTGPVRALLVGSLGYLPDPVTLHRLYLLARDDRFLVRTEALRALGRRPDSVDDLPPVLVHALKNRGDVATLLTVLDLIRARPDAVYLPTLRKMPPARDPRVGPAITHTIETIGMAEWERKKRAAEDDGYAPPPRPKKPTPRPRYDLVFAFDATGSMRGSATRMRRKIEQRLKDLGPEVADVRVGLVVFRQVRKGVNWKSPDFVPLTHDLSTIRTFLANFDQKYPADSQGAAIFHGLHLGLDRMAWRADATREFLLYCDTGCHEAGPCRRVVTRHADEVRIRFWWRGATPHDHIAKLAALAGEPVITE
ncbi:MAG: HEAT repeat domain-containing protein [Planctomycetota bacterium]